MGTIFDSIGITLSGGGYKASAFHLGTISYLHNLGVETNVKAMSTVSGGTVTGIAYILSLIEKKEFKSFFLDLYNFLKDVNMLEDTLEYLAFGKIEIPSNRKDMIVAASRVFNNSLVKKETGSYLFGDILDSKNHISEFIINTTELSYGLDFRFQKSEFLTMVGNKDISLPVKFARNIQLADIVASSTCFPGALEPIAFPDDFTWKNNYVPPEIRDFFIKDGKPDPIGLMDGGIYDNQGIESIMLADDRMDNSLDQIIVSDVDANSDNFYHYPKTKDVSDLNLGKVDLILKLVIFLCLATATSTTYHLFADIINKNFKFIDAILNHIIPLLLSLSSTFIILWLRGKIKDVISSIPLIGNYAWRDIKWLTINQIVEGLTLRVSSIFVVATKVITKRVRTLVYKVFYNDEKYDKKRVSNLLETLAKGRVQPKLPAEVTKPSKKIVDMATSANKIETTAWIEKESDLPLLITVGQFTICYNLIKYIVRVYGDDPQKYEKDIKQYWDKLVNDWNRLVVDTDLILKEFMD